MEVFFISFSYIIVLALGVGLGILLTDKVIVKKAEEPKEEFNYDEYKTQDGKFFTNKIVRGDDE